MNIAQTQDPTQVRRKRAISRERRIQILFPWLLLLPTLLLILGIMVFPVSRVFWLSLQHMDYTRMNLNGWAGLDNFRSIFSGDTLFLTALKNTAIWVFSEVFLQLAFGMIVALLLNRTFRGRGVARSLMLVPWAVSGVLTTMLWALMYNQHIGIINDVLLRLGIIQDKVAWLANTHTVFPAVILAELWRGIPFFAISLLAALQGIPAEIYESSAMDGCGRIRQFGLIVLPFLKESIVFATLLRGIWEFNSVDMIFTMTNGGPMDMTTTLPIYLMKTAVIEGNYGYGSALGVITFGILMVFAIFYLKVSGFGRDSHA